MVWADKEEDPFNSPPCPALVFLESLPLGTGLNGLIKDSDSMHFFLGTAGLQLNRPIDTTVRKGGGDHRCRFVVPASGRGCPMSGWGWCVGVGFVVDLTPFPWAQHAPPWFPPWERPGAAVVARGPPGRLPGRPPPTPHHVPSRPPDPPAAGRPLVFISSARCFFLPFVFS